ncbi:MAG: endolytic transglycosylase MltG [Sandaracinobacteroides sp.]
MRTGPTVAGQPRWVVWGAALSLLAMLTLSLWTATMWRRAPLPGADRIEVNIPRGSSIGQAADILEQAGVVDSSEAFELLARTLGDDREIQYGTYGFFKGEGWGSVLERLKRGDTLIVRIPIPEGMPSIQVAERLNAVGRLEGRVEAPPEGSILPATYEAKIGERRADVIKRMQDAQVTELDRLWERRSENIAVKSREDAVILAGIVEKETGDPSERRRIAGLYSNRLKQGMRLQADPTVIYPVTRGKPLQRRIRLSELRAVNSYNTYTRDGLPGGPITNPGRESLAAVLDPEVHDYLYMVADGSGGHAFARTYPEHQANVEKWRAYRRERGI